MALMRSLTKMAPIATIVNAAAMSKNCDDA